eukprot:scaffold1536_cov397-Prasinococcus_capsulatus_cf.AAC.20
MAPKVYGSAGRVPQCARGTAVMELQRVESAAHCQWNSYGLRRPDEDVYLPGLVSTRIIRAPVLPCSSATAHHHNIVSVLAVPPPSDGMLPPILIGYGKRARVLLTVLDNVLLTTVTVSSRGGPHARPPAGVAVVPTTGEPRANAFKRVTPGGEVATSSGEQVGLSVSARGACESRRGGTARGGAPHSIVVYELPRREEWSQQRLAPGSAP